MYGYMHDNSLCVQSSSVGSDGEFCGYSHFFIMDKHFSESTDELV